MATYKTIKNTTSGTVHYYDDEHRPDNNVPTHTACGQALTKYYSRLGEQAVDCKKCVRVVQGSPLNGIAHPCDDCGALVPKHKRYCNTCADTRIANLDVCPACGHEMELSGTRKELTCPVCKPQTGDRVFVTIGNTGCAGRVMSIDHHAGRRCYAVKLTFHHSVSDDTQTPVFVDTVYVPVDQWQHIMTLRDTPEPKPVQEPVTPEKLNTRFGKVTVLVATMPLQKAVTMATVLNKLESGHPRIEYSAVASGAYYGLYVTVSWNSETEFRSTGIDTFSRKQVEAFALRHAVEQVNTLADLVRVVERGL